MRSIAVASIGLGIVVLGLAWSFAGGARGWLYLLVFATLLAPGLPLGFSLFGSRHGAGWIAGAVAGYALSALVLWAPVQGGLRSAYALGGAWVVTTAAMWVLFRGRAAVVELPVWRRRDTAALLVTVLVVPLLVWKPFGNIGTVDGNGNRLYRAYFTADFLWHGALTGEIARLPQRPRNPYLARRPLHYYWAYFVPPAIIARFVPALASIERNLIVNALCAGMLFIAAVFVATWCAVPRAGPAAVATLIAVVAASAEGSYALWRLWAADRPWTALRHLNIDAMTAWVLQGLTVDGLPRSLWYTPQHAAACALGVTALIVPAAAPLRKPAAGLLAGMLLGLALAFSPFLGGVFSVIYGVTAVWIAVRTRTQLVPALVSTAPAAFPVVIALFWCVASGTFEGAGGAVAIGVSKRAAAAPLLTPALALGPILGLSFAGILLAGRTFRCEAAIAASAAGLGLFYLVTLTPEPIWVGWRAGQILLVMMPALVAAFFASLVDLEKRGLAIATAVLAVLIGLPTTIIDTYNAQDVENREMGPGFRWTVAVPPDTQAATEWIRNKTPEEAVVQMSVGPRGRETWTLVPTFARRRMAAGQPISLLHIPEYDAMSAEADAMFGTPDSHEAWRLARSLRVDYVYADAVERAAFGEAAMKKFDDGRYFARVFARGSAAVFAVR